MSAVTAWRPIRRATVFLLLAALLPGCASIDHIRQLREAEETFSRAAEQENQARLGADAGGEASQATLAAIVSDGSAYRLAAQITDKLIREKEAQLRQDNLLCTAYVIRSFSLWRLGDGAGAAAASKVNCGDSATLNRDRALLKVVPALVEIDEADALGRNDAKTKDDYNRERELVASALVALTAADRDVPRDHPVRAYLFMSRLAAIRVQHSAATRERVKESSQTLVETVQLAGKTLTAYRTYLQCDAKVAREPVSVRNWQTLFGGEAAVPLETIECTATP